MLPIIKQLLWIVSIFFSIISNGFPQSKVTVQYQGKEEALYYVDRFSAYVLVDGKRRKADWPENKITHSDSFGKGFVEIKVINVETPIENSNKRQTVDKPLFKYEAEFTADTDLNYCYGVLVYLVNGNPTTYFKTIGSLKKGRPKKLKIETTEIVSKVGKLHIFSKGEEIQSTGVQPGDTIINESKLLQESTEGIPVIELLETSTRYPHILSPEGDLMATFRDKDTHSVIAIIDVETGKSVHQVKTGEFSTEVADLEWVSPHEVIFVMFERWSKKPGTRGYHRFKSNLYYYKLGNESVEKMRKDVASIYFGNLRSNKDLVVLRDFGERAPYRYNFRTRKAEPDQNLKDGERGMFDLEGLARVKSEIKGDTNHFFYLEPGSRKWKPLDRYNNEESFTFNYKGSEFLEQRVEILAVHPDPKKLYIWLANDAGVKELGLYNVETGTVDEILFKSQIFDLGGSDISGDRIYRDKTTHEIIGLVIQGKVPTVIFRDETFNGIQDVVNQALPDRANRLLDWAKDLSTFIYFSYNDKSKGQYYLFRPQEKKLVKFYDLSPRLKNYNLGTMRPFQFPARDGYQVHGYLTFPPNYKKGEQMPLIVYPHGGPTARDVYEYDSTVQYFASLGYGVLQINYRGSAGYGLSHLKQGLEGELAGTIIDDIADGTRFLIDKGFADKNRVVIMGASFGGYCTYMGLIRYPHLFKAGVAVSAISHWKNMIRREKKYGWGYSSSFWDEIISRSEDPDYARKVSPYYRAKEINRPLLIIHGNLDPIVTFDQAELMEHALRKEDKEVKLIRFPYSGHGIIGTKNRSRYLEEIKLFIEKHTG